ncbi:IS5 family transposase [Symbiopectobacterium purcellii]|uniref:IS5 family transposase n=1 Tax=Symbiopectobacterium purcellii TaxID=2871826 RepID=UPI0020766F6C|nr:IS5 family transposase [Symbiopectobacterium purcellii]
MPRLMLSDDQYERISPFLPGKDSDPGRTAADNRLFVEAVLWIARTGSPWRDLPPDFGLWNCVYKRFARWSRAEIWHSVFAELAGDADFEEIFIDSTIVRVHQHAAGAPKKTGDQSIGRSRGGLTTKIHALVDGLGMLARFSLTGGQKSDTREALPLLGELKPSSLAADKAYDTNVILQYLESVGIQAVIPSKENRREQRPLDKHLYASRNLIERFFCRIKQFRRVATRFDKLSKRFASFVALAAAFVWLC